MLKDHVALSFFRCELGVMCSFYVNRDSSLQSLDLKMIFVGL